MATIETKSVRPVLLCATLLALGVWAALSVYGSFIGVPAAKAFFCHRVTVLLWFALLTLLAAGLILLPTMLRRPAGLAMHIGAVLVIAGSMWSSAPGHAVAARLLHSDKVRGGFIRLAEGQRSNLLIDEHNRPIAELPFTLQLKKFTIDHYPAKGLAARLWADIPTGEVDRNRPVAEVVELPWQVGKEVTVPRTRLKVKLLELLPHARPVGSPTTSASQPVSAPMDFVSDPAGGHLAARVEVSYDGRAAALWAAIEPGKDEAILSGEAYLPDDAQDIYSIMSILRIQRATGMPKSYESDTQVVVDGRAVDGKVIEVNRPLTYGGYQISQSSCGRDAAGRVYTVLEVRSNAGLYVVYAGFGLICLGAMWWCWLAPLAAHLRGRKAGDGA